MHPRDCPRGHGCECAADLQPVMPGRGRVFLLTEAGETPNVLLYNEPLVLTVSI